MIAPELNIVSPCTELVSKVCDFLSLGMEWIGDLIRKGKLVTLISAPFILSSFLILVQQTVYLIKSYLTKTSLKNQLGRHSYPELI